MADPTQSEPKSRYRTIVADPPWDHSDGTGWAMGADKRGPAEYGRGYGEQRKTHLPYKVMSVEAIKALPVHDLAEHDAHLYLWTTQRFLRDSFDVAEAWGFRVVSTQTWCKAPKGFFGGAFRSSTEFFHFCRRGTLAHQTQAPTRWFTWPRVSHPAGAGQQSSKGHSHKPEAFIDLVEQVSPGPYLEMFARRARFCWDYWGDQSLGTAELPDAA